MLGGFIMNLTLKQLFKFGAACTCACALSATAATNYVADSFEVSDGGSEGLAISQYKYTVSGLNETNYSWVAESGDASTIVSNDAAYADITGDGPLTGDADLVLNLETEGNTLSRTVDVSIATGAYIDTLVQFTPSEDDPTIDTGTGSDVKVALFVNASSNLVVTHRAYSSDFLTTWATNSVVDDVTIDAEKWYRLTMQVDSSTVPGFNTTKIWLDGTALSHTNALTSGYGFGGSYFAHIDTTEATIAKVGFQGTGMLDEFVVSDTMPDLGGTVIMLTLVDSGPGAVTFATGNYAGEGGTVVTEVESGTLVYMSVDDWYQMTGETGSDASFASSDPITGDQIQDHDATFTADNSSTVTVSTATLAGDWPLGGGIVLDLESVSTWALANGYPQADVEGNPTPFYNPYLLGVSTNDGANAELVITSIAVDSVSDETTITVEATGDNDAVDFTALNGVVTVYTNAVLDGTFGLSDSYDVTASIHDTATVVVTNNISELFIKAKVEVLPAP